MSAVFFVLRWAVLSWRKLRPVLSSTVAFGVALIAGTLVFSAWMIGVIQADERHDERVRAMACHMLLSAPGADSAHVLAAPLAGHYGSCAQYLATEEVAR